MKKFISKCEEDTLKIGKDFANNLLGGEIITLEGDLGAGKTVFTKGVALGLKIEDIVTSPTFTIMNMYLGEKLNLYHFDMYRLNDESELRELGFDEYIGNKNGVSCVEWAERTPSLIKGKIFNVKIDKIDDNTRKIMIDEVEK
jgi:tRNA threonylcarbamoyladenosine biosynthesis protein TsaE